MLPAKVLSLWTATTPSTDFPELDRDIKTDVAIIGGGIAGLNAAYYLKTKGLKVVVIESTYIASGTSGNTTAKVTSQHELKYAYIEKSFGKENAQIYADSNQWAITELKRIIKQENINCDFHTLPAYTYTRGKKGLTDIKREVSVSLELKLPASFVSSIDSFPFKIQGAIKFENQAYFHPRKYLLSIAKKINSKDSFIFEKTTAQDIHEESDWCEVITDKYKVKAKHVIVATDYPFYDKDKLFSKVPQFRSYVLAVQPNSKIPKGMFIGTSEKDISFRLHKIGNEEWLLIGGVHHLADDSGDPNKHYQKLEKYARDYFDVKKIGYKWAAQDSMSLDKIPCMGKVPSSKRILVTTGYGAWGITTSFVSAKILTDIITGEENPWQDFYDPLRIKPKKNYSLKQKSNKKRGDFVDINTDEGKVIEKDGKKIAAYKDKSGKVHAVSAVCTHQGCLVGWNGKEKTWDCPCHGSRFDTEGKVINGPAVKDLPKEKLD